MTEEVPVWLEIFDAIEDELGTVLNTAGEVAFSVIPGPPKALPLGGPYACFWYMGRDDPHSGERKTFGNVMYAAGIQIMCFWPVRAESTTAGEWDCDIATIDTAIRRKFRANSTLNGSFTDLEISVSHTEYGYVPFPLGSTRGLYRILDFELWLDNLEGEEISG